MADGSAVWNLSDYDFIHGDAPASVNPSLWRQERLNNIHGLFEVTQGVYQLRGFDLSNMSIIEGERGWILVDPLTTRETAAAALAFARQQLGYRPVTAVIITHSHIDHFGGVLAVLEENGDTEIIAPQGFMSEAYQRKCYCWNDNEPSLNVYVWQSARALCFWACRLGAG
jgi:alkyl sulfatase BDS1-like metallo-beta-lactamase superfamily hydrolase